MDKKWSLRGRLTEADKDIVGSCNQLGGGKFKDDERHASDVFLVCLWCVNRF